MRRFLLVTLLFCLVSINVVADSQNIEINPDLKLSHGDYEAVAIKFKQLAEAGDKDAQANLGYLYYVGEGGVPQDYKQAVYWYRKAAIQGNRDAQYNLAVSYAFGEGVAQDLTEAAIWYRRAAEQDHIVSQYSLGISYLHGEGVPQDRTIATHWFKKAAEQGHTLAQVHLGSMYHTGEGVEQDYTKATYWYRMAADGGNPTAQYNLGIMYITGKGIEKNDALAKNWFRQSAEQDYRPAQNELTNMEQALKREATPANRQASDYQQIPKEAFANVEDGDLLAIDRTLEIDRSRPFIKPEEAVSKVEYPNSSQPSTSDKREPKEEELTSFGGLFSSLGDFFFGADNRADAVTTESSVPVIDKSTLAQATKAELSEYRIRKGENALANKDYREAAKQFKPLAEAGNSEAQAKLGSLYYAGKGVEQNFDEAYNWYKKAAEQNNMDAQYNIGNMYLLGEGVEQNNAEAEKWYALASNQGHIKAKINVDNLNKLERLKQRDQRLAIDATNDNKKILELTGDLFEANPDTVQQSSEVKNYAVGQTPSTDPLQPLSDDQFLQEGDPGLTKDTGLPSPEKPSSFPKRFFGNDEAEEKNTQYNLQLGSLEEINIDSTTNLAMAKPVPDSVSIEEPIESKVTTDIDSLHSLAIQGEHTAQYQLGTHYYSGNELKQNYTQAALWYRRAAQQGNVDAQYSLGTMYLIGEGIAQDSQKAAHWYGLASAQGHDLAKHNLDNLEKKPLTTSQTEKAEIETTIPANKEIAEAVQHSAALSGEKEYEQGLAYTYGDRVQRNDRSAFDLFYKAAQKGYAPAQYKVAIAFAFGEGTRQDKSKATEWYQKAANQNYTLAQRNLANIYLNGIGLQQDKVQALAWYHIVADSGSIMDIHRRDILQKQLTTEEIAQSKELAKQIFNQLSP